MSSGNEVMVILSDGKPITVIKTKEEQTTKGKTLKTPTRHPSKDSPPDSDRRNTSHLVASARQTDKDLSKIKDFDESVELRRLRSENQVLKDRIRHMEELMTTEKCEKDTCIERLKRQLKEMDECEKSSRTTIGHLMNKIEDLQNARDRREAETNDLGLQVIQDELVACKLREAEANSSFKELQQKFHHLEKQWQMFLQESKSGKTGGGGGGGGETENKTKNPSQLDLKDQVMALRIRETSLVSDLNEVKQRLMELETQNHIFERQAKRQETENAKLLEALTAAEAKEQELHNTIRNLERKLCDLQSKQKEDGVLFKIQEVEFCQMTAEMRRRIAELEIENQELLTMAQLHNKDQDLREMENRILELQDEVLNLRSTSNSHRTQDIPDPLSIMTESFIAGDSTCLQPTNFDSIFDFSDSQTSHIKEDIEQFSD